MILHKDTERIREMIATKKWTDTIGVKSSERISIDNFIDSICFPLLEVVSPLAEMPSVFA
jgi:hypothetical protein